MKQLKQLPILGVMVAILSACAAIAATPADNGQIEITLNDYDILPRAIRVKAGQEVTFVLKNEGDKLHELMIGRDIIVEGDFTEGFTEDFFAGIRPEIEGPGMVMGLEGGDMAGMEGMEGMTGMDEHAMEEAEMGEHAAKEEMAGMAEEEMDQDMARMDEHVAGQPDEHAMVEDEMAEVGHDEQMSESTMMEDEMEEQAMAEDEMSEAGMEHGPDEMDEHTMAEGEMAEPEGQVMEHNQEEMATAEMEGMEHGTVGEDEHAAAGMDEHAMAEGDMAGMGHNDMVATSFGALQRPLMDAHAGLMVMLDPAPMPSETVTTITFTVPEDKVGDWEMGCFQEQGQHYDDGMRGILIVEPAS